MRKSPWDPRFPQLLGRRPSGPRLPVADPPGSANSRCACRLSALPKPPVFFRLPPLPNPSDLEQYSSTATEGYGGAGFSGRARTAELERRRGLHDLSALRLRRRPALPHDGWLQPQAEAAAARAAPKEAVQALGTHLAKGRKRNFKISIIPQADY